MKEAHRDLVDETEILRKEYNRFVANHEKMGRALNKEWDDYKEKTSKALKQSEEDWSNFKLSNSRLV